MMSLILFMELFPSEDIYLSCLLILYFLTSLMMLPKMIYSSALGSDLFTPLPVGCDEKSADCKVKCSPPILERRGLGGHFYYYYDMSLLLSPDSVTRKKHITSQHLYLYWHWI